jgi:hypothetical protein
VAELPEASRIAWPVPCGTNMTAPGSSGTRSPATSITADPRVSRWKIMVPGIGGMSMPHGAAISEAA